jgi:hypothetical protein
LLGTTLKDRRRPVDDAGADRKWPAIGHLLVCDYMDGAVRGYAQFDLAKLAEVPS